MTREEAAKALSDLNEAHDNGEIMTLAEAAVHMGVPATRLTSWVTRGVPEAPTPAGRLGRGVWYWRADIEAMAKRAVSA